MIEFEDLMRKQAGMKDLAATLVGETDAAKIQSIAGALQAESAELQQMARTFEQQQQAKHRLAGQDTAAAPTVAELEAEAHTRETVETLLAQIAGASPEAAQAVARLKADPAFLGGAFAKK